MGKDQTLEETAENQDQTEPAIAKTSDVDLKHVRGLMYTLVTVCVFCASILLGPDEQILPADGNLKIPIFDLTIQQGSFLYIGPSIIICLSMYTYLFLLNILVRMKAGHEYSDQYIFTMRNPAAQIATYGVFFWLPALILFAFAFKALPRPESANLLGTSLLFLIFVISIQLIVRVYKINFLGIIAVSIFCVGLVLIGFGGKGGWLENVRQELQTLRPMALEKVDLEERDLRDVEIRNAKAESIMLKGADLRRAVIIDADLVHARLDDADLRDVHLECTDLRHAIFDNAKLQGARVLLTNFGEAKFRGANLKYARFYAGPDEVTCRDNDDLTHSSLAGADLERADLTGTQFIKVSFGNTNFNGANLTRAKIIGSSVTASSFLVSEGEIANLSKSDLRCSRFSLSRMEGANLRNAELGGADLTRTGLAHSNLFGAKFEPLNCSDPCIENYINDQSCEDKNEANIRRTKLVKTELQFADLQKAHLQGVDLTSADLRGANLNSAEFSTKTLLTGSNLLFTNLSSAKGLGCEQLQKAKYWRASLRDKDFKCGQQVLSFNGLEFGKDEGISRADTRALSDFHAALEDFARPFREKGQAQQRKLIRDSMKGAVMSWVNIRRLNLDGIRLEGVKLDHAILTGTHLKGATLRDADLTSADLVSADLRGAILTGATLTGAKLNRADLDRAYLYNVKGVDCTQLKTADNWQRSYRSDDLECGTESPSTTKVFQ